MFRMYCEGASTKAPICVEGVIGIVAPAVQVAPESRETNTTSLRLAVTPVQVGSATLNCSAATRTTPPMTNGCAPISCWKLQPLLGPNVQFFASAVVEVWPPSVECAAG